MAKDTKEKILGAALEIFARDGYAGTNIKEIAEAVGIVKSALYRHYESKEAIWAAVADRIAEYYEGQVGGKPTIPQSAEELCAMTLRYVDFTLHDRKIVQVRKLLTVEQYRDERNRDLANAYFLDRNVALFTEVFAGMMDNGSMKRGDPELLAFAYTTPVTALIHLCDRDPGREAEAMERLQAFVQHFAAQYGTGCAVTGGSAE